MKDQEILQILKAWEAQNQAISDIFLKFEDGYYNNEVAPGRNRAVYLFGHLIATSDLLLPMLGLGEQLYPQQESIFITNPDRGDSEPVSIAQLRQQWTTLNQTLTAHFQKMDRTDWLGKHTKVSQADFEKDPLRNKLNVLISRIGHLNYHRGQLAFLTPRA